MNAQPSHLCPVCGYDLGFAAWDDKMPSFEICSSCGIQFGYTDMAGGDARARLELYKRWRQKWIRWWNGVGQ
jgi:hypothetical protein